MAKKTPKRTAIVPRAVFAVAVALSSIPAAACTSQEPSHAPPAQLRPAGPPIGAGRPSRATPTPTPTSDPPPPVAELTPLSMPYRPGDVVDAGAPPPPTTHVRTRRVHNNHQVILGVAVRPPPYYGVAATVAVRPPPYAVAARGPFGVAARFGVAME